MLIIGLTGPSGAGKGVVSDLFRHMGLQVIDADRVYHTLLEPPSPCLDALCDAFGAGILSPDGSLDRKKLGAIVFSNHEKLALLNRISHEFVMASINRELQKLLRAQTRAVVIDAPQLFEACADRICNVIVSVLADRRLRLERIMERDGIDAETAMRRCDAQKSDAFFRAHSNYVIENNGNTDQLYPQVRSILKQTGVLDE